jgi:hypothetical protein
MLQLETTRLPPWYVKGRKPLTTSVVPTKSVSERPSLHQLRSQMPSPSATRSISSPVPRREANQTMLKVHFDPRRKHTHHLTWGTMNNLAQKIDRSRLSSFGGWCASSKRSVMTVQQPSLPHQHPDQRQPPDQQVIIRHTLPPKGVLPRRPLVLRQPSLQQVTTNRYTTSTHMKPPGRRGSR